MRDWDDAFANMAYVPGSEALPDIWAARAAAYRSATPSIRENITYGPGPRHRFDLVMPARTPRGLAVFVHGGYWMAFDRSFWTDLAKGARACGWAVALPSYTLAPSARIAGITRDVAMAIEGAAALIEGPIRLIGHSAGGHLVTRMICDDSPLAPVLLDRIERTFSISGLHDLRPLVWTKMNATLRLTDAEAAAESPVLHRPRGCPRLTCWVGGDERPELIRQSRLMAMMWDGLAAEVDLVLEAGIDHFSILEGLRSARSPIVSALCEAA
jgi:acetyl esterase/lipase